jgi:hypothetical protein
VPLKKSEHWVDKLTVMHPRLALAFWAVPAYSKAIVAKAERMSQATVSDQLMMEKISERAKTGMVADGTEHSYLQECIDRATQTLWRDKVIAWRDQEPTECDHWHVFNLLYFQFRVNPRTPAEVDALWAQIMPTYDFFYTETALSQRYRARLFGDVVRRLCQISLPGNREQKKRLLTELLKIQEQMRHALPRSELDRTVSALELHLKDASKPAYVCGSVGIHNNAMRQMENLNNPYLAADQAEADYKRLNARIYKMKQDVPSGDGPPGSGDTHVHDEANQKEPTLATVLADK